MNFLNAPEDLILQKFDDKIIYDFDLTVFKKNSKVKFQIEDAETSWLDSDDFFIKRIQFEKLNRCFIKDHIKKEIEIKNLLDKGVKLLDLEKFPKAIEKFDNVIYYDSEYSQALLFKSYALFGQNHFIKSFRFYKKAIKINEDLRDNEYHKLLKMKSSKERDNFPKIKMFIFTGDEYLSRGNFKDAIRYYDKALANPSKFKSKILYKLLNKKATALFELKRYDESLNCFKDSLEIHPSDYAYFYAGLCSYYLKENPTFYLNRASNIKKDQLLQKALVFSEIGLFDECIESLDELFLNHYAPDRLYFTALNLKISVLEKSDRNSSLEKTILDNLNF